MDNLRSPFQGVWNIIRFNWHFYVLALVSILVLLASISVVAEYLQAWVWVAALLILLTTLISLLVSYYVYDVAGLYKLNWLDDLNLSKPHSILNINAGFDETSVLIKARYPDADLLVFDFYDSDLHTEVSIKRARRAYPPYPGTRRVNTSALPANDQQFDLIFVILAAHEIRVAEERIAFFKELRRCLRSDGKIVVVEHQRDWPNFLAYNIGFLHFLSPQSWQQTFDGAQLRVIQQLKITSFISVYLLKQ